MFEDELKELWLSVSDIALPLAELRDEYLYVKRGEARIMLLTTAYENLNAIEQALFEYIALKSPLLGRKPNREMLMMARAAIENGRILTEIVRGELALLKDGTK